MKERAAKRLLAAFMAVLLVIGMIPANVQAAASPKLSASKTTLYVGGKTMPNDVEALEAIIATLPTDLNNERYV